MGELLFGRALRIVSFVRVTVEFCLLCMNSVFKRRRKQDMHKNMRASAKAWSFNSRTPLCITRRLMLQKLGASSAEHVYRCFGVHSCGHTLEVSFCLVWPWIC